MESKSKKFRDAKNRRFGVVNAVKGYWDFGILEIQIFKKAPLGFWKIEFRRILL